MSQHLCSVNFACSSMPCPPASILPSQVEDFHVYMMSSGRINVAGLSEATIDIAADAIYAVVTGAPSSNGSLSEPSTEDSLTNATGARL